MQATQPTQPEPTPTPIIGTPAEQTSNHIEPRPVPTPAEHTAAFRATRPGDCITDH
jgi:hypothetical protein